MRLTALVLMVFCVFIIPVFSANGVLPGSGTESEPYLIEDLTDFLAFADEGAYWDSGVYTKLTCDIDLSGRTFYKAVIASSKAETFLGVFDGDGHIIRNLTIDSNGTRYGYFGLFGFLGCYYDTYPYYDENPDEPHYLWPESYRNSAEIKNLGLENAKIYGAGDRDTDGGGFNFGGLCALNGDGTISNCYSSGLVSGNYSVGGLCGTNIQGTIENCYVSGIVAGGRGTGGLCDFNSGIIRNCYSNVKFLAWSTYSSPGGICHSNGGTIENCFFDADVSDVSDDGGGTGLSSADMKTLATFVDAGWDFTNDWQMLRDGKDYPRLTWQRTLDRDIDGTYGVDVEDLAYLAEHWGLSDCGGSDNCGIADLDLSGAIGFGDFALISEHWLMGSIVYDQGQKYYGIYPMSLPGIIEAESYDYGGQGVSYYDTTEGNEGDSHRSDDVDISIRDGSYIVGYTEDGEWLEYTVNVVGGVYDMQGRFAALQAGGQLRVLLNGTELGVFDVPVTGDWEVFETVTLTDIELPGGDGQLLRLEIINGEFNINWVGFDDHQTVYDAENHIPGTVEAENYDNGGQGISYYDTTDGNLAGNFRADHDVDVASRDGGWAVGYTEDGEWLEYTVDVTYDWPSYYANGVYDMQVRIASLDGGGQLRVKLGNTVLGTFDIPATGGWDVFKTITISDVAVPSGYGQILRLEIIGGWYNINWLKFDKVQRSHVYPKNRLPGIVEAEDYDSGGQGCSYYDTSWGNEGGDYRDDDVDITEQSEGNCVSWTDPDEWLEYTVDVFGGIYDIKARVAAIENGGQLLVKLGNKTLGTLDIPNTGGWDKFATVKIEDVFLPGGYNKVLRFEIISGSFNLNWVAIDNQEPFGENPIALPGTVEAEDYDLGGMGVSYHDKTAGNLIGTMGEEPGVYRDDDVDIAENDGGYNLAWTEDGEWLEYTVDVVGGVYDMQARVATTSTGSQLRVLLNGVELGTFDVPDTDDWTVFETITLEGITLPDGDGQILRLEIIGGWFNFNWVRFGNFQLPYKEVTLPGIVEAEDYDYGGQGYSYYDTGKGNFIGGSGDEPGFYRDNDVDISERDGGYVVAWFEDSEWLEYTLDVVGGVYDMQARVATGNAGGQLRVLLDGVELGVFDVPDTGGWDVFETLTLSGVTLPDGNDQVLRVEVIGGLYNLNWIGFE